tara:strand:+ start:27659 stop:27874 length:216 start_codon:yes stop_codon:yes gene_type:complete
VEASTLWRGATAGTPRDVRRDPVVVTRLALRFALDDDTCAAGEHLGALVTAIVNDAIAVGGVNAGANARRV